MKSDLFKIIQIHGSDSTETQEVLESMNMGVIDGVIVKQFFSKSLLSQIKNAINSSTTDIFTISPYGKIIGKKLPQGEGNFQKLGLENYYSNSIVFKNELPEICSIDFEKIFEKLIKNINSGSEICVPEDEQKQRHLACTIRILFPDCGGIQSHVGNEFIDKMPEIKSLSHKANTYNQLSYFSLIQEPESGGQLVLFDALWEESKSLKLSHEETIKWVEKQSKKIVDLAEGDLIIFSGGRIWHKVENIVGQTDRITIGGFMAKAKDDEKWYYWS